MTWNEALERVRARLNRRRSMYRALFKTPGDELAPAADYVLRDLARYCYATNTTLKVSQVTQQCDPLAMAFAEGRRDVFNRIVAICNLTPEQVDRIAQHRMNDE